MSTASNYEQASDLLADVEFVVKPHVVADQEARALVAIGHALLALVDAVEEARRPRIEVGP